MIVYDKNGRILYASTATRDLFPLDAWPDHAVSASDVRAEHYKMRDEHGNPIPVEQSPVRRILNGETFQGEDALDVIIRGAHGDDIFLSLSGSPMRDTEGAICGGVLIARDVTKRRALERRTHRALEGLLTMAEALVHLPEEDTQIDFLGRQLAELVRSVLNCQRASIYIMKQDDEILRPIAVVGLLPEQENDWWQHERQNAVSLQDSSRPDLVQRLRNCEVIVIDATQPPFGKSGRRFNIKQILIAPMCIGERLIGVLSLDFGGMEHKYTQNEISLASAVAKVAALVLERQRLLLESAEAQGRVIALREANRRMEDFLGLASHELRTPLTTIKANIQLALRRLKSILRLPGELQEKVDGARQTLERAERQVGVLNRLVSDMIDISRIQSGRLQLQIRQEPCDLVGLVREVIQEQRKTQPTRTIHVQLPEQVRVPVMADPDRIAQVLTNFLTNALKYSAAAVPVDVTFIVEGREARVVVRDYGQGLSEEDKRRIWECFYQSPKVRIMSGSGVGLGLGLYISRTLIEHHHGTVGVDSTQGEGSTFWFTLPIVQQGE